MIFLCSMNKRKDTIPKKFQKINETHISELQRDERESFFKDLLVFPKRFGFYSKGPDEDVVLMVRKHWIVLVPSVLFTILLLVLPALLLSLSFRYEFLGSYKIYIGAFILSVGIGVNIILTIILKWYCTLHIVTDRRFVLVRMENAFFHSYAEAPLNKIQDVTHRNIGIIGTLFDVGEIDIDTAGHEIDFELKYIPKPREIQNVLMDLIQMRKRREI